MIKAFARACMYVEAGYSISEALDIVEIEYDLDEFQMDDLTIRMMRIAA